MPVQWSVVRARNVVIFRPAISCRMTGAIIGALVAPKFGGRATGRFGPETKKLGAAPVDADGLSGFRARSERCRAVSWSPA